MPAVHRIDREQRVVLSRLWGDLTVDEIEEHRRAIRADPDFAPSHRYIVDMRYVTTLGYPSARVRHVAGTPSFRGDQRRAIVASTDEQFGVARMFATFAALEGELIEVFREWAPAVDWLGLTGELARDPAEAVTAE